MRRVAKSFQGKREARLEKLGTVCAVRRSIGKKNAPKKRVGEETVGQRRLEPGKRGGLLGGRHEGGPNPTTLLHEQAGCRNAARTLRAITGKKRKSSRGSKMTPPLEWGGWVKKNRFHPKILNDLRNGRANSKSGALPLGIRCQQRGDFTWRAKVAGLKTNG